MSQVDDLGPMVPGRMVWGSWNQIKWPGVPAPRLVCRKINTAEFKMERVCPVLFCCLTVCSHIKQPQDKSLELRLGARKSSSLSSLAFSFLNATPHQCTLIQRCWMPKVGQFNIWLLPRNQMLGSLQRGTCWQPVLLKSSFSALVSPSVICSYIIFNPEYHPVMPACLL